MAKRKRGKPSIIIIVILVIAALFGVNETGLVNLDTPNFTNDRLDGEVYVHFIDVGQGSSTLIQQGTTGILIDSGLSEYGESVTDFIKSCGVKKLEYVVATHPHNDHIGSMVEVMSSFETGEIIMPELSEINIPTTKVYETLIDYIYDNEITASTAEFGDVYKVEDISFQVLGPVEQVKDLNDMSVVCKVSAGEADFMLLGDAENQELSSILEYNKAYGFDFESDVILLGHHGSSTSVYEPFLYEVDAEIAVVSAGKNNSYNHPHPEAIAYCEENGMEIYRTDLDGTVSFKCTAEGLEKVDD